MVLAFFVILTLTFLIVQLLPGDPAVAVAGPQATNAEVEAVRTQLGLDVPLWEQYLTYLGNVLTGDLGTSFMWNLPVSEIVTTRLWYTTQLAIVAMLLTLLIALPLGMAVAVLTRDGRRRWLDALFGCLTGLFSTVPSYVLATLLVAVVAVQMGAVPPAYSPGHEFKSAILPVVALTIAPTCTMARIVRRETDTVLTQDYIRTARGWRLPGSAIYLRYVLPNIVTVTLTLSGLVLASLLGGAVIVETVFSWPGLGSAIVAAITNRDYPLIQGVVLVLGMLATLITLVVDVLLGVVDSRTLGGRS
ncbi:ABC transporter permease (plasmid) [Nocardioides sp. R1-1]|uniref:ABC transporter permease n=1 Tax=Nocardioides sp. R1-1 TaxID=3383502 RepID=UPI0038D1526C